LEYPEQQDVPHSGSSLETSLFLISRAQQHSAEQLITSPFHQLSSTQELEPPSTSQHTVADT